MDKLKFGAYIKEARIKKNYTQQELADLLFVGVSAVSKWERGVSYPDITLVPDICRVLEITENELIESSHDFEYRKMKKDSTKFNNMKKGTFWTLNICYLKAILVCFIVNLSANHTLSWFFIVLTSILCAYSFCPTITMFFPKYKKLVFAGSTFISLFLLFLTCSIYGSNYWFMIPTLGVLLAYFIIFYPIVFTDQKKYLDEEKYKCLSKWFLLSYSIGMLFIIILLLIFIYFYNPYKLGLGLLISGGCYMLPIVFGILNLFNRSQNLFKPILISLSVILVLVILASLGRAIYLKTTEKTLSHDIVYEYNNLKIDVDTYDINIYSSDDDENKIVYVENKKITIETEVVNDVLVIKQIDSRKFYDRLFDISNLKVELYLSKDLINSLEIECSTGNIDIYKGVTFNNVEINNSTGNINFKTDVSNKLDICLSTGNVLFENCNIGGNVSVETSTGDIQLLNVNCNKLDIEISTGKTKLANVKVVEDFNLTGGTGNVIFDDFDAKNIYVEVSTGNVTGTISTIKSFYANSSTGNVNVPETRGDGECKVKTSTGDINLKIK